MSDLTPLPKARMRAMSDLRLGGATFGNRQSAEATLRKHGYQYNHEVHQPTAGKTTVWHHPGKGHLAYVYHDYGHGGGLQFEHKQHGQSKPKRLLSHSELKAHLQKVHGSKK